MAEIRGNAHTMTTTAIQDLDAEELLTHFALPAEAESIRQWCVEHEARSDESLDARLQGSRRLREQANKAFGQGGDKIRVAAWLYLAALHHVDLSTNKRRAFGVDHPERAMVYHDEVLRVLSNVAAAWLKMDDFYNAERAASLGLWYAERCGPPEVLHAKLLYRRAVARFKSASRSNEDAQTDAVQACSLQPKDGNMRALLRQIRKVVQQEKDHAKASFGGFLKPTAEPGEQEVAARPESTPKSQEGMPAPALPRDTGTGPVAKPLLTWRTKLQRVNVAPALQKVLLFLAFEAAVVALDLPGSQFISWWQTAVPVGLMLLRPLASAFWAGGRVARSRLTKVD